MTDRPKLTPLPGLHPMPGVDDIWSSHDDDPMDVQLRERAWATPAARWYVTLTDGDSGAEALVFAASGPTREECLIALQQERLRQRLVDTVAAIRHKRLPHDLTSTADEPGRWARPAWQGFGS